MALHAARPRVTTDGKIELTCDPCARGERRVPVAAIESPLDVAEPPRRRPAMFAVGAGASVLALVSMFSAGAERSSAAAQRASAWPHVVGDVGPELELAEAARIEPIDPIDLTTSMAPPPVVLPPMPERDGEPLDDWYPTLQGWVHPVPGSPEVIPRKPTRVFGAHRDGVARAECNLGHCGVDLEGQRGQPVIAVAWGTVVRIQRDASGRGGRYVKIEHPDFVYTSYFHLDAIAPGLAIGDEIDPGQPVGTLGRSGIHISMPHLHFAIEVPQGAQLRFIDPVPFLARAEVLARDAVPELDVKPPVDPEPVRVLATVTALATDTAAEAEPAAGTAAEPIPTRTARPAPID